MELRIKKATWLLQEDLPWIDREDVEKIVNDLELKSDTHGKLSTQQIVDFIYNTCKDV